MKKLQTKKLEAYSRHCVTTISIFRSVSVETQKEERLRKESLRVSREFILDSEVLLLLVASLESGCS